MFFADVLHMFGAPQKGRKLLGSQHFTTSPSCSRCKDGGHIEICQKMHEATQIEVVGFLSTDAHGCSWILMVGPFSSDMALFCDSKLTSLGKLSINSHGTMDIHGYPQILPCQAAKSSPSVLCTEITPAKCLHVPAAGPPH